MSVGCSNLLGFRSSPGFLPSSIGFARAAKRYVLGVISLEVCPVHLGSLRMTFGDKIQLQISRLADMSNHMRRDG